MGLIEKIKAWYEKRITGTLRLGPVVIYGKNIMDWSATIKTKRWGYICFTLPVLARFKKETKITPKGYSGSIKFLRGYWFQWYFFLSPNTTPWAATFYRGNDKKEVIRAQIRKYNFGHNFNPNLERNKLVTLNVKYDFFRISDADVATAKKNGWL